MTTPRHAFMQSLRPSITLGLSLLIVTSLMTSGCKRESAAPQGVVMELVPSKTEYRLDEKIVLTATITNPGNMTCRLMLLPELTVHILAVNRDGNPLVQVWTSRTYLYTFEEFILGNLDQLEPKASKAVNVLGESHAAPGSGVMLDAAPPHPDKSGLIMRWSIDRPGSYTVTARYVQPVGVHLPPNACQASSDPVTSTFTVTQE